MNNNEIYHQMLSAYELMTEQQKRNATFEVNQQIILAGLYNGGGLQRGGFLWRHLSSHLSWLEVILRRYGLLSTCTKRPVRFYAILSTHY